MANATPEDSYEQSQSSYISCASPHRDATIRFPLYPLNRSTDYLVICTHSVVSGTRHPTGVGKAGPATQTTFNHAKLTGQDTLGKTPVFRLY